MEIGFYGSGFDDNHLLWSFLFDLILESYSVFEKCHPKSERKSNIYGGATGTNYGVDHIENYGGYGCRGFAGFSGFGQDCFVIFANFDILPEQNHYIINGDFSEVPRFSKKQKEKLEDIN